MSQYASLLKRAVIEPLTHSDRLNFFFTNRIPRRLTTRFMGWLSRIEHPGLVRLALPLWQRLGGSLNLHEAERTDFVSIHDCFTRRLKDGARPINGSATALVSPCDGIVGACGRIDGSELIQAKGFTYTLEEMLVDPRLADRHRNGIFVTLRLTSTMYHRFHAPDDCEIDEVIYVAGDTWNVNPPAVRRVERLYCRNERAIIPIRLGREDEVLTLVPVAAILVASIHLNFLDVLLNLKYAGPNHISCSGSFKRGDELGYFHHGSTIVVLAGDDFRLDDRVHEGSAIRVGEPLFRRASL